MKRILICPDGASDWPCSELGDRTPFEAAATPNLDELVSIGMVGSSRNVPETKPPGSDVACMALLGYDPEKYHSGRASLEAPSLGLDMRNDQTAVRCNLVTITEGVMDDFTAGHISTEESASLLESLNEAVSGEHGVKFYKGVSYRNLLLVDGTGYSPVCHPPHNITGEAVEGRLPGGKRAEDFLRWMELSREVFRGHPVNEKRIAEGKKPATQIWLWGYGTRPEMPLFENIYGCSGVMISAVALLKSLGIYAGLEIIDVPGATGYFDTDYSAKGRCAIDSLRRHDFVFVHVEAPDEMGHEGDVERKTRSIELIDEHIIGPVLKFLKSLGDFRIFVSPDHPTPCELKTHTREPVPFAAAGTGIRPDGSVRLTEKQAEDSGILVDPGWKNIGKILFG